MSDVSLSDFAAKEAESQTRDEQIAYLRRANRALVLQLSQAKVHKEEMVFAVEEATRQALSGLYLEPVPPPRPSFAHGQGEEEVAIACLSDLQLGKITSTYNSQVCERRVQEYAEKVLELTDIQRTHHPVRRCKVYAMGDFVEGELIFPGQAHQIDSSLFMQSLVDGPRIFANFLRTLAQGFEEVSVVAVPGNHGHIAGRSYREMHRESNADRMLYQAVEYLLSADERIQMRIARDWYLVDREGKYSALLFHGDQIKGGFAGMPWYGFQKKVNGWKSGAISEEFTDVYCGHWHQPTTLTLNNTTVRVNGSTESSNEYAQEQLAAVGRPAQRLVFVHPGRGHVTAEYVVWLTE